MIVVVYHDQLCSGKTGSAPKIESGPNNVKKKTGEYGRWKKSTETRWLTSTRTLLHFEHYLCNSAASKWLIAGTVCEASHSVQLRQL